MHQYFGVQKLCFLHFADREKGGDNGGENTILLCLWCVFCVCVFFITIIIIGHVTQTL